LLSLFIRFANLLQMEIWPYPAEVKIKNFYEVKKYDEQSFFGHKQKGWYS
jgi:hypothetical protein